MSRTMTKKKAKVEFGTPPPRRSPAYDWEAVAQTLRAAPNEWARVFENDRTTLVSTIRQGGIVALRASKGFEVRTSNNKRDTPRTCDLWMRYVPSKDKEKD